MADLETPEQFAERLADTWYSEVHRAGRVRIVALSDAIRARDAAVRREARELLFTWEQLAREGAFGEDFAACAPDCDCVVCATHAALATGGSE